MNYRCAVFIDGGYLEKILKHEFAMVRIDFGKLAYWMAQGIDVLRTYYYHCPPYQSNPPTEDERTRFANRQRFFQKLERIPRFEVCLGRLAFRGHNRDGEPIFEQKRVDILLGIHLALLSAKHQISHAVIMTSDSDFIPAIQAAKDEGVCVTLVHSLHSEFSPSQSLWDIADERLPFTREVVDSILLDRVNGIRAAQGR